MISIDIYEIKQSDTQNTDPMGRPPKVAAALGRRRRRCLCFWIFYIIDIYGYSVLCIFSCIFLHIFLEYSLYIPYRRLGGRPLPGNRFVSFVRAYARCPLPSGNEPKRSSRPFPFSLSAREAFPFPLRSKVKSKWTLCEIQCELKVNSKWKQCEILPPPPNPPIQLWLALSVFPPYFASLCLEELWSKNTLDKWKPTFLYNIRLLQEKRIPNKMRQKSVIVLQHGGSRPKTCKFRTLP